MTGGGSWYHHDHPEMEVWVLPDRLELRFWFAKTGGDGCPAKRESKDVSVQGFLKLWTDMEDEVWGALMNYKGHKERNFREALLHMHGGNCPHCRVKDCNHMYVLDGGEAVYMG